ncbi:MAG: hypothetical protein WBB74_04130 [Gaiellaceae bacterium]
MSLGAKLLGVLLGVAAGTALIVYYIVGYLIVTPHAVAARQPAPGQSRLTLQTVASLGFGPHPDWVSYLAQDSHGKWHHTTVFTVPAHATVTMTILQYDTATGLRNGFWGKPRGIVGDTMIVNGKPLKNLNPDLASHTFAVPDLGVSVPLEGVSANAKNQCSAAPCTLKEAHNTVVFTFRTGKPGTYRWQCFVPCAAAFIFGFGGPMQSLGYMDGLLHVA